MVCIMYIVGNVFNVDLLYMLFLKLRIRTVLILLEGVQFCD